MRQFLVISGVLMLVTLAVAPTPDHTEHSEEKAAGEEEHDAVAESEEADEQDIEQSIFAQVEKAGTNAEIAVNLMRQTLSELLEKSAMAMESTEELLKSGVYSVNSIATGASTAAKHLGGPKEAPSNAQKSSPAPVTKPKPKNTWGWW